MSYIESLHKNAVHVLHLSLLRTPLLPELRHKIIMIAFKSISCLEWAPELVFLRDYRNCGDIFVAVCAPKGWVVDFGKRVPPRGRYQSYTGEIGVVIHSAKIEKLRLLLRPESRIEKHVTQLQLGLQTNTGMWIATLILSIVLYFLHSQ